MLTAAKELSTATTPLDLVKKLHQQHQEISTTYYEIPAYTWEKWAKHHADQELKESLDYFNKVMENPEEYDILFVGPHFVNIPSTSAGRILRSRNWGVMTIGRHKG
ncbi:hypothetical protein [Paenibacillus illinoisensis]|uniref:hypothetical protein n=1 Tax=Paenibacillus illinoisensis TaxID=59845 RepID=UPI000FDBD5C2|nr:hypothetical protein [Paenibacillus illinoisensis]